MFATKGQIGGSFCQDPDAKWAFRLGEAISMPIFGRFPGPRCRKTAISARVDAAKIAVANERMPLFRPLGPRKIPILDQIEGDARDQIELERQLYKKEPRRRATVQLSAPNRRFCAPLFGMGPIGFASGSRGVQ